MADIVNNHTVEIRLNAVEAKSRCSGQRNLMAMCHERFSRRYYILHATFLKVHSAINKGLCL
jgi:hypothetical protein